MEASTGVHHAERKFRGQFDNGPRDDCNGAKVRTPASRLAGVPQLATATQTVEPVFGIIKSVMGFRQFMLGGLDNVRHEWTLICLAWNLKRMAVLRPQ